MKVYINRYRDHWISPYTILDYVFFWTDWSRCSRNKNVLHDEEVVEPPAWVEHWATRLEPVSRALQCVLNRIHPRVEYVQIDPWDTWSMDSTLSYIILPMLRQLQATKHGAPLVDDEDVPDELKSTAAPARENEWDTDENHFKRWDWVLEEMIWAFKQKVTDGAEDQFFDHSVSNGKNPWDTDYVGPAFDREGYDAWQARKANGFRLFGKYYEALWD